jgi:hypothetical protein
VRAKRAQQSPPQTQSDTRNGIFAGIHRVFPALKPNAIGGLAVITTALAFAAFAFFGFIAAALAFFSFIAAAFAFFSLIAAAFAFAAFAFFSLIAAAFAFAAFAFFGFITAAFAFTAFAFFALVATGEHVAVVKI